MTLYHCAPACAEDSIRAEGLRTSAWEGCVYLGSDANRCASLMWQRLTLHVHGIREIEVNGETARVPDLRPHEHVLLVEVDESQLDPALLTESTDHSAEFFGDDWTAYTYAASIPSEALTIRQVAPVAG